jgi:hypothetical protein
LIRRPLQAPPVGYARFGTVLAKAAFDAAADAASILGWLLVDAIRCLAILGVERDAAPDGDVVTLDKIEGLFHRFGPGGHQNTPLLWRMSMTMNVKENAMTVWNHWLTIAANIGFDIFVVVIRPPSFQ